MLTPSSLKRTISCCILLCGLALFGDTATPTAMPSSDPILEYGVTGTVVDHTQDSVWHAIVFENTFENAPVLLADLQSNWGGETAGLRRRNLTSSGLEISIEEDRSLDGESNHMAENVGFLALSADTISTVLGQAIGEAGSLEASSSGSNDWHTLNFQRSYTQPVVRMQIASVADDAPAHIRLRNVTGSSVEYRIEEWDCDDAVHAVERIDYVVVETGDHALSDNIRLLAGRVDIGADGSGIFTKVLFAPVFPETPVVLSQSQSTNDSAAIVTRLKDTGPTGSNSNYRKKKPPIRSMLSRPSAIWRSGRRRR